MSPWWDITLLARRHVLSRVSYVAYVPPWSVTDDVLSGGLAVGCCTCDLQVAGSILVGPLLHRSTQPCIPPGSLNRVPALAGGKGGIFTSVGWQITLCDPTWHVNFPQRCGRVSANCDTLTLLFWQTPASITSLALIHSVGDKYHTAKQN